MVIKISKFKSSLHEANGLSRSSAKFIHSVEKELKQKLIFVDDIKDYDCDLKLIYIESGGSEGDFLRDFKKIKSPYIFITSGENNSLAASLEILHYLELHHLKGEILHGDAKYIAKRIKSLCKLKK